MPRAGSHYNLGTSRGPDKIGSRAGSGPRAVSCTWLSYHIWMYFKTQILYIFVASDPTPQPTYETVNIFTRNYGGHIMMVVVITENGLLALKVMNHNL